MVGADELGADEQPAYLLIRAPAARDDLEAVLNQSFVRLVRVPPAPYLSPTDWLDNIASDFEQPERGDGCVGIVDDGVLEGHSLLTGLVDSFQVPEGRIWSPPTQHGTMVAGLAAYGDFEAALRDGLPLPAPISVVAARVR